MISCDTQECIESGSNGKMQEMCAGQIGRKRSKKSKVGNCLIKLPLFHISHCLFRGCEDVNATRVELIHVGLIDIVIV